MGNIYAKMIGPKHHGLFTERYKVGVVAGSHKFSGLDAEITVVVVGKGGRSVPHTLKKAQPGDHAGPHIEVFYLNTNTDLEQIGCIEVYNAGRGANATFEIIKIVVDKVMEGGLQHATYWERWIFPCYAWVPELKSRLFFVGSPATIPSRTAWWLNDQRKKALDRAQETYKWKAYDGLPAGIACTKVDQLPRDDHLPGWHERDFKVATANHMIRKNLSGFLGDDRNFTTLTEENYTLPGAILDEMYAKMDAMGESKQEEGRSRLPRPLTSKTNSGVHWQSDITFAKQFTQGVHAKMLKVCRMLPQAIKELQVSNITFRPGMTFQDEAREGRVFQVDFSDLRKYFADPLRGIHLAAPICWFYLFDDPKHVVSEDAQTLLPVAIRLTPEKDAPFFTPDDLRWDWLTAKAWVVNADAQYHMAISYYLKTIACAEPFVVAMYRNLSVMHPIYKLLRSYSQHSLSYAVMARDSLVSDSGLLPQLFSISEETKNFLRNEYQKWRFEEFALPFDLQMRGFDGREFFPDYPYREDGLLIWAAIVDFVKDYVTLYYSNDDEVEGDAELQGWYNEAFQVGHQGLLDAELIDFEELDTINGLAKTLVFLIWNFCGQNTALVRPSYDAYGFPPNRPTTMHRAPPTKKGECTEETFLAMLPNKGETSTVLAFMHWRSERTTLAASFMGPQIEEQILDPEALEAYDRFQESLSLVQRVIEGRNDKREVPYVWQLPSMVNCGLVH